jgi:translation elongation factor EF-4
VREVFAAAVALLLLFAAASLSTTLRGYRHRRRRAQDRQLTLGRTIVAELPTSDDLVLFSEDAAAFYYGDRAIPKSSIVGARLLINGRPIAAVGERSHHDGADANDAAIVEVPEEGIPRDRWDVAIETDAATTIVECGSVRERVSQELGAAVFEAVKREVEGRVPTTPSRAGRRDG